MGTTWREQVPAGIDEPPVAARDGSTRDPTPLGWEPVTAETAVVGVLVQVAQAEVDDAIAAVFLRCWAAERHQPRADAAAALASASRAFGGVADAALLSTVDRWIDGLVPPTRSRGVRARRFLFGHT